MLQSVKDFAEKKEKYALKKSAHRDDHDRPREKIGDLQIRFGVVELAADASRHNADDLRRDARFPAETERDAAAREQGGAQRRKEMHRTRRPGERRNTSAISKGFGRRRGYPAADLYSNTGKTIRKAINVESRRAESHRNAITMNDATGTDWIAAT